MQPALGLSNRAAGCDGDGAEAEEEAPADSLGVGGYLDRLVCLINLFSLQLFA